MPALLLWYPQARRAAAERLYDAIEAKCRLLIDFPRIGPRRPEIRPTTRLLVVGRYLAFYETHPDLDDGPIHEVEIVRVLDGRRDLPRLFGSSES
jgi:toxin ParE1/3/4